MTAMELGKQIEEIKKAFNQQTQFIAIKEFPNGEVHARAYLKKNKSDVLQFGWSEYKEPAAPKATPKRKTTAK